MQLNCQFIAKLFLSFNLKKNMAFTLAEVLIVLLIIGVVASLTIPTVINNTNKAEYVSKLKKEYSVLSQAYKLIILDSGGSILNNPYFNTDRNDADADAMNVFATKLNVVKVCPKEEGCWYKSDMMELGGGVYFPDTDSNMSSYGNAILADGAIMAVGIYDDNCTTQYGSPGSPFYRSLCGFIYVDVNGNSKPNVYGRDVFWLWIATTGIYPGGVYNDGAKCLGSNDDGCSGKILSEGTMNY